MSAPTQVISRALTFNFAPSVNTVTGVPNVLEIAIIPLDDANSTTSNVTFAGGLKTAEVALSNPVNTVIFELIPTHTPGLDAPINYRVMWRAEVTARTYTYDFAMPDADTTWDDLVAGVGNIITGDSYLQQSDLGVPNRVAQLNNNGVPVTSNGIPVATTSDITTVLNDLTVEVNDREAADAQLNANLQAQISTQVSSTINTAEAYTNNQVTTLNGDIANERGSRINSDADLQTQITNNFTSANAAIDSINADLGINTNALAGKADLVNGTIPLAELPDAILTSAVAVPNEAAMLALSTNQVHKGDLAVRPDGIFLLTAADPTVLGNWISLSIINSVNGYRGTIQLSASDVGAIPVGGSVTMNQVTGLNTALIAKANQTDMAAAQANIAAIQSDPTLVHTTAGVIPASLLDSNMVYLNAQGQLTYKNGNVIPLSGGGGAVFSVNGQTGLVVLTASSVGAIPAGGSVSQGQVTGLSTTLSTKADLVGGLVPLAQLPNVPMTQISGLSTALTAKADLSGGLIPLGEIPTLPQTQITGLSTLVSGNQLTGSTNAINRIASLESWRAAGGSGSGGGGSVGTQTVFFTSSNTTTPVIASDFSTVTNLNSPWGIDADGTITGTTGTWYYLYTGVRSTDVAYPYISQNGHLSLRKWNENGPADPVYATQSDLVALTTQVNAKASQTDLVALQNTVNTKANQSDLTTIGNSISTLATTSALNALATTVGTKANQSDLAATNATVATLATQAALTSLTTTVGTKANQTDLAATNSNVSALQTALPAKADLVAGVLKASEIPPLTISNVTGLSTALAGAATLTNGVLTSSQIPTNIPQTSITNLNTTLGAKADLVNGVVPLSELPFAALPDIHVVVNTGAMTALTTAQVHYGSLVLVTGGSGQGTYVFTGTDPSQLANWTELTTPQAPVTSVNNKTGGVVLSATDVGALAANASIPINQITGLSTQLGTFALQSALTAGLAGKMAPSDVQNMFYNSSMVKRADYVSTSTLASLSGQQSVDGVLVPNGAIVLVTSQASSVNNGLWVVNAGGAWTRPPDFATGSFLARDTIVIVSNATGSNSGVNNSYTVWQMQVASGFIDTNTNNWTRIAWVDPPFTPVAGNGISVSGSTFAVNTAVTGNLVAASGGLDINTSQVPRKMVATVPASNPATINHNLNTFNPSVSVWATGSNTLVLAGAAALSANSLQLSFQSTPSAGQYTVTIIG